MSQFLIIPCKKGYEIKFIDPIINYVRETYGEEQCNNHKSAFNEFNNMRTKMLNKLCDKHESTVKILTRYYDQLVAIESKIPIEENGVRIDFKWDDAFGKESLFGKKNSLQIASGGYERICVLFNIGAVCSQIADIQKFTDDNGLKIAAKYLQQAAGIFSYLRNTTFEVIQREPTSDLNPDTLSTLTSLMLAQAQELIFTKSSRDQMKEGNVAKIAQQTADLYADTLKLMQLNSVKSIWPKEWIPVVADKQAGYHAMAEYYQAKACGAANSFGEQIARLKKASDLMKVASTCSGAKFMFRSEQGRIKQDLDKIEKENNMIYHDTIPDVNSLAPILKAVLARELPLENPMDTDFKDLFSKIIPLALMSSIIMFQNKQKSIINSEIFRLKEANNMLGGILASLNVPAVFEDAKNDKLPHALLEKAAMIRKEGGIDKIDQMRNLFPDILLKIDGLLKEGKQLLDDEENADKKLREQFKERWSRTPSFKLTESWRAEWTRFSQLTEQAKGSDEAILKIYQENNAHIRLLSQGESAIEGFIPKSGTTKSPSASPVLKQEIKNIYDKIEDLKISRNSIIAELSNTELLDLASDFSRALTVDDSVDHDVLADQHLNKILAPYQEKVQQSIDAQGTLVESLQTRCSKLMGNTSGVDGRESAISSLMFAANKYQELLSHLQEGLKFYQDFTEILIKFQTKVKDFCFARQTEKEELMKDLQSNIVKERSDIPASGSNFQATSGGTGLEIRPVQSPTQYRPQMPYPNNFPGVPYMPGVPQPQYRYPAPGHNMPPPRQMPQYPAGYNFQPFTGNNYQYPR